MNYKKNMIVKSFIVLSILPFSFNILAEEEEVDTNTEIIKLKEKDVEHDNEIEKLKEKDVEHDKKIEKLENSVLNKIIDTFVGGKEKDKDEPVINDDIDKTKDTVNNPIGIGLNSIYTHHGGFNKFRLRKSWTNFHGEVENIDKFNLIKDVDQMKGAMYFDSGIQYLGGKINQLAIVYGNKLKEYENKKIITENITDGSVTEEKLADNSISTIKIQNGSVTEDKLADNSVSTIKIQNSSITEEKLADNSISESKLQDNSVSTRIIQNGAVTNDKLAINSISYDKLDLNLQKRFSSMNAGISSAIAVANLPTSSTKKYNFSMGTGYYDKSFSVALGFSGRNDTGTLTYKVSSSINTEAEVSIGLGLSYNFGEIRDKHKEKVDKNIKTLEDKVVMLEKKYEYLLKENFYHNDGKVVNELLNKKYPNKGKNDEFELKDNIFNKVKKILNE